MNIDADTAASALVETGQHTWAGMPAGWVLRDEGTIALVSGAPVAALNVVWAESADPQPRTIAPLLDRVAATGLPHGLQLRPGAGSALAEVAAKRGLLRGEDIPLMVLEDPAKLESAQHVEGLEVRQLQPEEAALHVRVSAAGFEAPEEVFQQFITPSLFRLPGIRCYLGEVGGRPVTTGIGVTVGRSVAIFNVATPPADRRRGYGAAVTARAVADGVAAGARWSVLQSSAAGYRVYQNLGYRTVELWQGWYSPE